MDAALPVNLPVALSLVFGAGLLVGFILGKANSGYANNQGVDAEKPRPFEGPAPDPSAQVLELIRRNNLIMAIKIYREETGLGLKESKDVIDDWKRRNP